MMRRSRRGITFLEVTIASVLVGLLFVGAIRALGSATRTGLRSQHRVLAAQLARGLQAEICSLAYQDPDETPGFGSEPSETSASNRSELDDVDDFHNWSESPIVDRDGIEIPNLGNWQRTVSVAFVDPDDLVATTATDLGMKRVTVQVRQISPTILLAEAVGYQSDAWSKLRSKSKSASTKFVGNRPPIAKISADKPYGVSTANVNFQGSSSFDPDGDGLTFAWDFGDGGTSNSPDPSHNFSSAFGEDRTFIVRLIVTDEHGATSAIRKSVVVVAD